MAQLDLLDQRNERDNGQPRERAELDHLIQDVSGIRLKVVLEVVAEAPTKEVLVDCDRGLDSEDGVQEARPHRELRRLERVFTERRRELFRRHLAIAVGVSCQDGDGEAVFLLQVARDQPALHHEEDEGHLEDARVDAFEDLDERLALTEAEHAHLLDSFLPLREHQVEQQADGANTGKLGEHAVDDGVQRRGEVLVEPFHELLKGVKQQQDKDDDPANSEHLDDLGWLGLLRRFGLLLCAQRTRTFAREHRRFERGGAPPTRAARKIPDRNTTERAQEAAQVWLHQPGSWRVHGGAHRAFHGRVVGDERMGEVVAHVVGVGVHDVEAWRCAPVHIASHTHYPNVIRAVHPNLENELSSSILMADGRWWRPGAVSGATRALWCLWHE
eukprot:5440264-Prymnesium_polylepis.1